MNDLGKLNLEDETRLAEFMAEFHHDPLGHALAVYPWGEGELAGIDGPRAWQRSLLRELGEEVRRSSLGPAIGQAVQLARASGHGIGKSACVAMIAKWALDTFEDTRAVLTANTDTQLRTKTWPELSKWHRMALNRHWFALDATALVSTQPGHDRAWRLDMLPWSVHNPQAFAGLHNQGKRLVLIFDEASEIDDKIWEVADGALTDADTEMIWSAFGNPTQATGRFRECFGRFAHRWNHQQIDSRQVEGTNKVQLDQMVTDWGEDSDYVRVRVRGMFPRSGTTQFIPSELVHAAASREALADIYDPMVLGVDVARFGEDETVMRIRKGRDARTHSDVPGLKLRQVDTMQVAARVAELHERFQFDAIFIDEGGVGGGVVDRCRQIRLPIIGVNFGGKPNRANPDERGIVYADKAAEMWGACRDWLKGGAIEDDPELRQQLTDRQYGFVLRDNRDAIKLEPKEDLKKRGLSSPDRAEALVITFAYPVQRSQMAGRDMAFLRPRVEHDYDPFNPPQNEPARHDYDPYRS